MDIKTFADLAKLADICRKKGIKQLKVTADGIEFQLGDKPSKRTRQAKTKDTIDTTQPSDEDILYWSSQGVN